jgi:hypothetical protein
VKQFDEERKEKTCLYPGHQFDNPYNLFFEYYGPWYKKNLYKFDLYTQTNFVCLEKNVLSKFIDGKGFHLHNLLFKILAIPANLTNTIAIIGLHQNAIDF